MDELVPIVESGLKQKRDFDRGRTLFAAAQCFACHRYDNEGGAVGPDLTGVSGRFSTRDLLESIVLPSKVISDQYEAVIIATTDGKVVTGRIMNLHGDSMIDQHQHARPQRPGERRPPEDRGDPPLADLDDARRAALDPRPGRDRSTSSPTSSRGATASRSCSADPGRNPDKFPAGRLNVTRKERPADRGSAIRGRPGLQGNLRRRAGGAAKSTTTVGVADGPVGLAGPTPGIFTYWT